MYSFNVQDFLLVVTGCFLLKDVDHLNLCVVLAFFFKTYF